MEHVKRRKRWEHVWLLIACFAFLGMGIPLNAQNLVVTEPSGQIVRLGDTATASFTVSNSTADMVAVIEAPEGFEIVSISGATLAENNVTTAKTGVFTASIGGVTVSVQLKATCDANSANNAKLGVTLYDSAGSTVLVGKVQSEAIVNIYSPNFTYVAPVPGTVSVGAELTRIMKVTQSNSNAYLNNLQMTVACDPSLLIVTKVHVSKTGTEAGPWFELPAANITSTAAGYTYTFTPTNTFSKVAFANNRFNYNDALYIRETYSITQCGNINATYTSLFGDGTNYCSVTQDSPIVTAHGESPAYSADITAREVTFPEEEGDAGNGKITFRLTNKLTDQNPQMYDLSIRLWNAPSRNATTGTDLVQYKKAYLTNYPAITLNVAHIGNNVYIADLSTLNVAADKTNYETAGLGDLDGDGTWDDLASGKYVDITVEYNIMLYAGIERDCFNNDTLFPSTFRRGDFYWKDVCGNSHNFTNAYTATPTGSSTFASMGQKIGITPNATLSELNLAPGDKTELTVTRLFSQASVGILSQTNTHTHNYRITLPPGLTYDEDPALNVKFRTSTGTTTVVVPSSSLSWDATSNTLTIKIWISDALHGFYIIPLKATGDPDSDKQIITSNGFIRAGKTATDEKLYGCFTETLNYIPLTPCSGTINLDDFELKRTSLGWTDENKTARINANDPDVDRKAVAPFDDLSLTAKLSAPEAITLTAGERLVVTIDYKPGKDVPYFSARGLKLYHNGTEVATLPATAVTLTSNAGEYTITAEITDQIGLSKPIAAIAAGDKIDIEILTRTTEKLPATPNCFVQLTMRARIIGRDCTGIRMENLRVFNDRYDYAVNSNNDVTHPLNTSPSRDLLTLMSVYMHSDDSYMFSGNQEVFPNEYRPNGTYTNWVIELKSLVEINQIKLRPLLNSTLTKDIDYMVSYSDGSTFIHIPDSVMHAEVFASYYVNPNPLDESRNSFLFSFTPINWTGHNTTVNVDVVSYPTSAEPQKSHVSRDFDLRLTPTNYSYILESSDPSQIPLGSRVEWPLKITNTSNWNSSDPVLPHSWLAFECDPGVTPVQLFEKDGVTPVSGTFVQYGDSHNWWFKLGDITVGPTKEYVVSCTYTAVTGNPKITTRFGSSPGDYPLNPKDGYANYNSLGVLDNDVTGATLDFTPPVVTYTGAFSFTSNSMIAGYNDFCKEITFEAVFENTSNANVLNPRIEITMPKGLELAENPNARVIFDGSTSTPTLSMSGNKLIVTLTGVTLGGYGNMNATATMYIDLQTACGFMANSSVYAEIFASNGAGVESSEILKTTDRLRLNGLDEPPLYEQTVNAPVVTPYLSENHGTVTLTGVYRLSLSHTGAIPSTNRSVIEIPYNMVLVSSTGLEFTQDGTRLTAPLTTEGEVFYKVVLRPINPEEWDCGSTHTINFYSGVIQSLDCGDVSCEVINLSDEQVEKEFTISMFTPDFSVDMVETTSYANASYEKLNLKGTLENLTGNNYEDGQLLVELYVDVDEDGLYSAADTKASGDLKFTLEKLYANGVVAFDETFNVRPTEICRLMLVIRKSENPYLCDDFSELIEVSEIEYVPIQSDYVFCQGEVAEIGDPAITGYTYLWSPATHLSDPTISNPTFTAPMTAGEMSYPYTLIMTRPGLCESVVEFGITVNALPETDVTAIDFEYCHGEEVAAYNFTGSTDASMTEYRWKLISVPSRDFGMAAREGVNTIPAFTANNTGTTPLTATYEVTPVYIANDKECAGESQEYTITVYPEVKATITTVLPVIAGETVDLKDAVTVPVGYTVDFYSNTMGAVLPSSEVYFAHEGYYTYYARLTDETTGCQSAYQLIGIHVYEAGDTYISVLGSDLCIDGTVSFLGMIDGEVPADGTVHWFSTNPAVATIDATGEVTGITAGVFNVIYRHTSTDGVMNETESRAYHVYPLPVAVTSDITVCVGTEVNLATLIERILNGDHYKVYSDAAGTIEIPSLKLTPTVAGTTTYYVEALMTGRNCSSAELATITVTTVSLPTFTLSAASESICEGASFDLASLITSADPGNYVVYHRASGSDKDVRGSIVTPTAQTTQYTMWITNINGDLRSTEKTVTLTWDNSTPEPIISGDNRLCVGASATLATNIYADNFSWTTDNASVLALSDKTKETVTIEARSGGTATVTYTYTTAAGCTAKGRYVVYVDALPTLRILQGTDITACQGETLMVKDLISVPAGCIVNVYTSGAAYNSDRITTGATAVVYEFEAEDLLTGCVSGQVSITIRPNAKPAFTLLATETTVCQDDSRVDLSSFIDFTTVEGDVVYNVRGSLGTFTNPVVTPTATTYYQVSVVSVDGCYSNKQTVRVNVTQGPAFDTYQPLVAAIGSSVDLEDAVTYDAAMEASYYYDNTSGVAMPGSAITCPKAGIFTYYGRLYDPSTGCWGEYLPIVVDVQEGLLQLMVTGSDLCVNGTFQFEGTVNNTNTDAASIEWISTNPLVATVDATGLVKGVNPGVFTIVMRHTQGGYVSEAESKTYNVFPLPMVVVEDAVVCEGTTINPSGLVKEVLNGDHYEIYNATKEYLISGPQTILASTTYYVRALNSAGACPNDNFTEVTVHVLEHLEFELSRTEVSICEGSSFNLNSLIRNASIADYKVFYREATSGNVIEGSIVKPTADETHYYVWITTADGSCASDEQLVKITWGIPSAAELAMRGGDKELCVGSEAELVTSVAGTTFTWTVDKPHVIALSDKQAGSVAITALAAGSATLTYTYSNAEGCGASGSYTVYVTGLPTVNLLAGNYLTACEGEVVMISELAIAAQGYVLRVYQDDVLVSSDRIVVGASAVTYEFETEDLTTACLSERVSVTITPASLPEFELLATEIRVCQDDSKTVDLSTLVDFTTVEPGSTLEYNIRGSRRTFSNPLVSPVGTTYYEVSLVSAEGCRSEKKTVMVKIDHTPVLNKVPLGDYCLGEEIDLAEALLPYEGTVVYYDFNDAQLASSKVTPISTGVYTWYARVTDDKGCVSEPVSIIAEVMDANAGINLFGSDLCVDSNVRFKANVYTGETGTGKWYSTNPFVAEVNEATGDVTGLTAGAFRVLYVFTSNRGCRTERESEVFNVYALPEAVVEDAVICEGSSVRISDLVKHVINGDSYEVYTAETGGSLVSGIVTLNTTTTYYVEARNSNILCPSATRQAVRVSVIAEPVFALTASSVNICQGTSFNLATLIDEASLNLSDYKVYHRKATSMTEVRGSLVIPTSATEAYYVWITTADGSCSSDERLVEIVWGIPAAVQFLADGDNPLCIGETLLLTASTSDDNYTWQVSDQSVLKIVNSTASQASIKAVSAGTATVSYSYTTAEGCTASGEYTVKVLAAPALELIMSSFISACEGDVLMLSDMVATAAGNRINLYDEDRELIPSDRIVVGSEETVYYVEAEDMETGCTSSMQPVTILPVAKADIVLVNDGIGSICYDDEQGFDLSTLIQNIPLGYVLEFNQTGSSDTFTNPVVKPVRTTRYEVTMRTSNGCSSERAVLTVEVSALPVLKVKAMDDVCLGQSIDLKDYLTIPANCTVVYYNDSYATLSSSLVKPVATGVYTWYAQAIHNTTACEGEIVKLRLEVLAGNAGITLLGSDICMDGSYTFEADVYTPETGTGKWYSMNPFVATIDESTGETIGQSAGVFRVRYVFTSTEGCVTEVFSDEYHVNALPEAVVADAEICEGASLAFASLVSHILNGDSYEVYDAAIGGNLVTSRIVSPGVTTTYYVEAINTNTGCAGASRTPLTVTVIESVEFTLSASAQICEGSSYDLTASITSPSISKYKVYYREAGTAAVIEGSVVKPVADNTTYYVWIATMDGRCQSEEQAIVINWGTPDAVVIAMAGGNKALCVDDVATLTPSSFADNYTWTTSDATVVAIATKSKEKAEIVAVSAGTAVISYSATVNGCTSEGSFTVKVNANPAVNLVTGSAYITACEGETLLINDIATTAAGSIINLYDKDGALIASDRIKVGATTTEYYVAAQNLESGCVSDMIKVTINPVAKATFSLVNGGEGSICWGDAQGFDLRELIADIPQGHSLVFNQTGSSDVFTNPIVTPVRTTRYEVVMINEEGCASDRQELKVTVSDKPAVRIKSLSPICFLESIDLATAVVNNGGFTLEYFNANKALLASSVVAPEKAGSHLYYVLATDAGNCAGEYQEIYVEMRNIPEITETHSMDVCEGETVLFSTLAKGSAGTKLNFYLEGTLQTFDRVVVGNKTIVYEVEAEDLYAGCVSIRHTVTVTAIPRPLIDLYQPATICAGSEFDLSDALGDIWQADYLIEFFDMKGRLLPSSIVAPMDTTTYQVKIQSLKTGCVSLSEKIKVNVFEAASAANTTLSIVGDNHVCPDSEFVLEGSYSGTETWKIVYSDGTTTGVLTNSTPSVTISGITEDTRYYIVSVTTGNGCVHAEDELGDISVTAYVKTAVKILEQPESVIYCTSDADAVVYLSVKAEGTGITYQWYTGSGEALTVATAQSATLELYHADVNSSSYYVVVTGDCGSETSVTVTVTQGLDLIHQIRNHTLVVNNNTTGNGGYNFVYYYWYKDNQLIAEGTHDDHGGVYHNAQGLDPNAAYHAEMIGDDNKRYRACEYYVTIENFNPTLSVYPNPVKISSPVVTATADVEDESSLRGGVIEVYNSAGNLVKTYNVTGTDTEVRLPESSGSYVLKFRSEVLNESVKLIVQ